MNPKDRINIFTRQYDQFLNAYLMFIVIFLYHLLFIFQGLDLTDFGYHMTHQVFSFTLSPDVKCIEPMFYLTDFIGGMWLSLIGHPNVLWARLGGVFLEALNAAIIFSILKIYFEKEKVFFVVFVSSIFVSIYPQMYIHYFTFPAFLINLELWIFNRVILFDSEVKKSNTYSFFLGFMALPIILSRITLLLIFIIPILFIIYYYAREKNVLCFKKIIFPTIIGIFFSIILFGFFLWYLDIFKYYFSNIAENIFLSTRNVTNKYSLASGHSMVQLVNSYLSDSKLIITNLLNLIVSIYILSIIKEQIGKRKLNTLVILLTCLTILYTNLFAIPDHAIVLLNVFIGIIIVLAIIYFAFNKLMNENIDLLLISSIGIMVINPIGSDGGLFKAVYGMWLALPLVLLCICKIKTDIKYTRISSMLSLIPILLVSLLCFSIFFNITYINYLDDKTRLDLNTEFSDPSLKGLYSTADRVKAVDELIYQIRKHTDKNDEILIANNIPTFYYLTETKPSFGNPWIESLPLDATKEIQRELEEKKELPKLFIYSRVSGMDHRFPNADIKDNEDDNDNEDIIRLRYLKNRYANDLNYTILWENKNFVIYNHSSM